jgi:glycosyltransferase involved in cell wall biosynthesis
VIWAKAVQAKLAQLGGNYQHFIPYLCNYGDRQHNIVLIPDLISRMRFPDAQIVDPNRSWLSQLRYKLPLRDRWQRWEEHRASQAERLVVYSNFVKDAVVKEFNVSPERVSMIPLAAPSWIGEYLKGVTSNNNPAAKHPESGTQLDLRSKYNLPDRFVLYVGGFGDRKNVPMLLRACGRVYEQDNSFRCVCVGLTDNFLQSSLGYIFRRELANPMVNHAIVKMPSLNYAELAAIYAIADFTVYPSLSEGFGLPIIEAAAAGKMCLCGDNSSMPEIQIYPEYLIDSEDETAWVKQILSFWQNPTEAIAAGSKCRKLVDLFSWQTSAKQLWQLLQQDSASVGK